MFKKFRLAAVFLAASISAAQAVTIETGKVYVGDYSFAGVSPFVATCCPVLSIDSPIRAQQYNVFFGSNKLDPGETISLNFNNLPPPPPPDPVLSLSTYTHTSSSGTSFLGLGINSAFDNLTSGLVGIRALSGSFDLDNLTVFAGVNATVSTTNGPVATTLSIEAMVTNIREVPVIAPPPPPPPNVVPLPASGLMLLSAIAGLIGWRSRR